MNKSVSDRIKKLREEGFKLSQHEMSARFRLSAETWARWERAGQLPNPSVCIALAELGYSLDWLATGRGEMKLSDSPISGAVGWDSELMGRAIREFEELVVLHTPGESGLILDDALHPEKDIKFIMQLYGEMEDRKNKELSDITAGEVVRMFRQVRGS